MAVKKTTKEKEVEIKEDIKSPDGEYFYAVGKRKTAVAQIRVYAKDKTSHGITTNGRKLENYFATSRLQDVVKSPIVAVGQDGKLSVTVKVSGGGVSAQAEAVRLGISRALIKLDNTYRKALKDLGYLTRDARIVERKKPGLKKARRAPQWAKR
jgi:small subunit ribosomal protein S9